MKVPARSLHLVLYLDTYLPMYALPVSQKAFPLIECLFMESAFVFVQVKYGQTFCFFILYIRNAFGVEQPTAALFFSSVFDVLFEKGGTFIREYFM